MKKLGILNSEITSVLGRLGHTDCIVIADCGLPIPDSVKRIDLALMPGLPSFMDTLGAVLADMEVEKAIIATEILTHNAELHSRTLTQLGNITIEEVSHEQLKALTHKAKAVIRTGEATPYANIILQAGVIFK
ncbi:D-ribose pyranase [Paenibacillus sp. FSL H8-0537]|uniref:D-ribose pyranase n=1 Tax=Paenibacillus sp. FSL H8-0537 TaxID=2921399 RepID=UPI003100FAAF